MSCCCEAERCAVPEYRCFCQQTCLDMQLKATRGTPGTAFSPGTPPVVFDPAAYAACLAACPDTAVVPAPPWMDAQVRIDTHGHWAGSPHLFSVDSGPAVFEDAHEVCILAHHAAFSACQDTYFACTGTVDECFAAEQACWLGAWQAFDACDRSALTAHPSDMKDWFKRTDGAVTTCAQDDKGHNGEQIHDPGVGGPPNPNPLPQCLLTAGADYIDAAWPLALHAVAAAAACSAAYAICSSGLGLGDNPAACDAAAYICLLQVQADYTTSLIQPGVDRGAAEGECVSQWLLLDVPAIAPSSPYHKEPVCLGDYLGRLKGLDIQAGQQARRCDAALHSCFQGCPENQIGTSPDDHYFCGGLCNLAAFDCAEQIEWMGRDDYKGRVILRAKECRKEFPRQPHFKGPGDDHQPGPFGHGRALCRALGQAVIDECNDRLARTLDECQFHCCGGGDCKDACLELNVFKPKTTSCPANLADCLTTCEAGDMQTMADCIKACAKGFEHCERQAGGLDHVCGADNGDVLAICDKALFPDCPDCEDDAYGTSNGLLKLPPFYDYDRTAPRLGYPGCD